MALTQTTRYPDTNTNNKFPTTQLFLLSLARISEPIALTSIFPYSYALVRSYNLGSEDSIAFYCGVLIAAFSLAEACTGVFWGSLSDRIGRKPVLLIGTGGTLLSLLIVGFADTFWTALSGRIVGGLLNGNIGVIQSMVGELTTNPKHERECNSQDCTRQRLTIGSESICGDAICMVDWYLCRTVYWRILQPASTFVARDILARRAIWTETISFAKFDLRIASAVFTSGSIPLPCRNTSGHATMEHARRSEVYYSSYTININHGIHVERSSQHYSRSLWHI